MDRDPNYRLVVQFTEMPDETLSKYVSGGPLADVAVAVQVSSSEEHLRRAQLDTMRKLDTLGIEHHSSVDLKSNKLEI